MDQLQSSNTIQILKTQRQLFHSYLEWKDWCFWSTMKKMGFGKIFSDQREPVTRELIAYIKDWGKYLMKKNYRRTSNWFLAKYCGLLWWKFYFVEGDGYPLIGNPENPDGTLTDYEYVFIHDDLFDRILETDLNSDI